VSLVLFYVPIFLSIFNCIYVNLLKYLFHYLFCRYFTQELFPKHGIIKEDLPPFL
jgi:hypothetical protein